jgi:hypothetical protein
LGHDLQKVLLLHQLFALKPDELIHCLQDIVLIFVLAVLTTTSGGRVVWLAFVSFRVGPVEHGLDLLQHGPHALDFLTAIEREEYPEEREVAWEGSKTDPNYIYDE